MSDEPQTTGRAAPDTGAAPEAGSGDAPDSISRVPKNTPTGWKERFRQLESTPHEIAGALHDQADDKLLTENQVRQALKEYRGIKLEYGQDGEEGEQS